ncbi:MAG: 1-acyl-sn-glycerol-3-phosphate acyltransferase [Acholeplasmatales bacterium]|jgi:1-acyl-sn-glycerol-3-phosphate acyltransferase|nr:1-acyl-sn-glycerol-3-phosphate acyltransferase [Acholeplasmatales bacterium]
MNRYVPLIDFAIPTKTDTHTLVVPTVDDIVFDERYPYDYLTFGEKILGFLLKATLFLIGRLVLGISIGFRIINRKNIKKYKKELKNGFLSVSNHIHPYDNIAHMIAFRYRQLHFPVWAQNLRGKNRYFMKCTGGIPVPEGSIRGLAKFDKTMQKCLANNKWVHVMVEGSMWDWFSEIRPFKLRTFIWAVNNHKPILPFVYTYRPISKFRHFLAPKSKASIDMNIGEPLYPDLTITSAHERALDLLHKTRAYMMKTAGITEDIFGFDAYDASYNPQKACEEFYQKIASRD